MPAIAKSTPSVGDVMVFHRALAAPRSAVFKAWTAPGQLAQWWGPKGFTATVCEADPRPGIASGHIPGSLNLPYGELFNPDGTWKDKAGLRAAFDKAGIDLARPVVTTCGSGITACVLLFGMHLLGKNDSSLYDGSWTEWGGDPATPKALGAD